MIRYSAEVKKNRDFFSVFPAQAGVNLIRDNDAHAINGIPRASGGEPKLDIAVAIEDTYSPRKRG